MRPWPFPVLGDPSLAAYQAFGLGRTRWRDILRPRVRKCTGGRTTGLLPSSAGRPGSSEACGEAVSCCLCALPAEFHCRHPGAGTSHHADGKPIRRATSRRLPRGGLIGCGTTCTAGGGNHPSIALFRAVYVSSPPSVQPVCISGFVRLSWRLRYVLLVSWQARAPSDCWVTPTPSRTPRPPWRTGGASTAASAREMKAAGRS